MERQQKGSPKPVWHTVYGLSGYTRLDDVQFGVSEAVKSGKVASSKLQFHPHTSIRRPHHPDPLAHPLSRVPGRTLEKLGNTSSTHEAEPWSWNGTHGSGGPVLLLSQVTTERMVLHQF